MKRALSVASAFVILSTFAWADYFQTLASRAAQNPTDIIDWSQLGPDGTDLGTPQLVSSFNGNLALVGNLSGGDFFRVDSGTSWDGNFDFGETLLWTGNPNLGPGFGGGGPFAMFFQNPVDSFGFQIQTDLPGAFTANVAILDPLGNLIGGGSFNGVSTLGTFDGSALFVGMADGNGANIGGIVISTNSGSSFWNNDFAIDDPSFTTLEPGSIALLGSAVLFPAYRFRSRLQKTASTEQR